MQLFLLWRVHPPSVIRAAPAVTGRWLERLRRRSRCCRVRHSQSTPPRPPARDQGALDSRAGGPVVPDVGMWVPTCKGSILGVAVSGLTGQRRAHRRLRHAVQQIRQGFDQPWAFGWQRTTTEDIGLIHQAGSSWPLVPPCGEIRCPEVRVPFMSWRDSSCALRSCPTGTPSGRGQDTRTGTD